MIGNGGRDEKAIEAAVVRINWQMDIRGIHHIRASL